MILVVGGIFSGKRAYVEDVLGYSDCDIADAVLDERPVVYNVQELVKREPLRSVELFEALKDKAVVVCNETGCGIVPADKGEMEVREATGKVVHIVGLDGREGCQAAVRNSGDHKGLSYEGHFNQTWQN